MLTDKQKLQLRAFLKSLSAKDAAELQGKVYADVQLGQFEEFLVKLTGRPKPDAILYVQKLGKDFPVKGSTDHAIENIVNRLNDYY
ncbi:hypothetical protein [Beggiatoa leptomitoformis]|uniref:Uncharacterized protein n=1 Tax=Beggiatoa leptomitoformis TaxID=288004 RepID=A0A2N9YFH3_9GAMM|nr:hypothetical protein [Beggiatoa leptomitoformis]ALG68423.1 hypothetical protein AL038_12820 [Beggiatoa leptomitoformis]AUI69248.1 hypothetical protein BLE401_11450 [Beggiatoa leptomitoformis]